jgi:hypothetical protein
VIILELYSRSLDVVYDLCRDRFTKNHKWILRSDWPGVNIHQSGLVKPVSDSAKWIRALNYALRRAN